MASTTYSLITSLLPDIWENALWYAQHRFVMPGRITMFTDMMGMTPRNVSEYQESGGVVTLAETDDLSSTAFNRQLLSTLTPAEYGKQIALTDQRTETDSENIIADATRELGYNLGKHVELHLLSNMADFTGGDIGDGSAALSLQDLFDARSLLEDVGVGGPYVAVMNTFQYRNIHADLIDETQPGIQNERRNALQRYFLPGIADMELWVSSLAPKQIDQAVTITGSPTGGDFTLTVSNVRGEATTAAIAYNANAAAVESALEALSIINDGELTVTGTNPNFVIEFQVDGFFSTWTITADGSGLTGGSSPDVTVANDSGDTQRAVAGVFTREAIAFDLRRGYRLEPDRDPSARKTELNATMVYAHGGWRPARGVRVYTTAVTPT